MLGLAQSRTPYGTALLELAVSPEWRFVLGVTGTYNKQLSGRDDTGTAALGSSGDKNWSFGGSAGLRRVLNPGGVVEISPLLTFGGYRAVSQGIRVGGKGTADGSIVYTTRDGMTMGYEVRLGLVLEHALLPRLFLRFETYLFHVGYSKIHSTDMTPGERDKLQRRRDLNIGYGLSPGLQLRLVF
jgi:hypothetical protein